jgi:hypothetical protein
MGQNRRGRPAEALYPERWMSNLARGQPRFAYILAGALHKDNFLDHVIAAAEGLRLTAVRS